MFKDAPMALRSLCYLLFAALLAFGSLMIGVDSPYNNPPDTHQKR
jgi:hypothetical protein